MEKLKSKNIKPSRFSVYESDEKTVLELVGNMLGKTNEIIDYSTELDERKLDKEGDFTGSWHGIESPVYADPGIANVVDNINKWYVHQGVTPEDFGCVGDGIADDTHAFQKAIDYAYQHQKPLIMSGKYVHTGLELKCNLSSPTGGQLIYAGVDVGVRITREIDLRGVYFTSRGNDLALLSVNVGSGVNITDCQFAYGGGDGIVVERSDNGLHITNNVIKHCKRFGIFSENIKRSIISNNSIYGNEQYGISLDGYSHGVVITGNHIFGNYRGGIAIEGEREGSFQRFPNVYTPSQHCIIANNHIDHNQKDDDENVSSYAMYIERCQRIVITGNLIRVARKDGLLLSRVEYGNINMNVFWKNTLSAIRLRDTCSGCMLFANVLGNSTGEKIINEGDSSNLIIDRYHKPWNE